MPGTVYRAVVDQSTASDWLESLALFEDANIYQTWSYGAVRWGERNLSHLLLKRGDATVAMAQVLVVHIPPLRIGIAHLRWGPLCHLKGKDLDPEVVQEMATALFDEYVRKRRLLLRVLPKAYVGSPRANAFEAAFSQFASEPFKSGESYRTLDVDLTPSLESLRRGLDQKWRNQLNRAERNGLVVKEDNGIDGFTAFAKLLDAMLLRKRFEPSSDIREFGRIQANLPPGHRMRVLLCEQDGIPVAGLVGSAMGDTGIYLFGATNEQGMKFKGAYLLQWRMIEWLKQNGVTHYDLGGINPETNPGVYHFKLGLSGNDVLYVNPLVGCQGIASKLFAQAASLGSAKTRTALKRLLGLTSTSRPGV